jgi:hypothetical protein
MKKCLLLLIVLFSVTVKAEDINPFISFYETVKKDIKEFSPIAKQQIENYYKLSVEKHKSYLLIFSVITAISILLIIGFTIWHKTNEIKKLKGEGYDYWTSEYTTAGIVISISFLIISLICLIINIDNYMNAEIYAMNDVIKLFK